MLGEVGGEKKINAFKILFKIIHLDLLMIQENMCFVAKVCETFLKNFPG